MSGTDRRSFLSATGAALGGLLLGGCGGGSAPGTAKSSSIEQTTAKPNLSGNLHAFGTDGHLMPGYSGKDHNHVSVLTSVNVKSGKSKQTALPMGAGHLAIGLGDGRILCVAHHQNKSMLVGDNHKEIASFISPENYLYGGHGLVLADQGVFLMCMRNKNPQTLADHGRLEVYDLKTLKLLDRFDSGGLHPHEIHVINWKKKRATHLQAPPAGEEVSMSMAQEMSSATHEMSPKPEQALAGVKTADIVLAELDKKLESITGRKRDYPLPYAAARELKLPVPLPFVRVNTKTGEREVFMTGDANHLRSQSVGYNAVTDTAIGVFYHADTAILHRNGGQPEVLNAGDVGLSEMRGVAEIPGTPYVALVAAHRGLVIYDMAKKEVVQRFPYQYFDTVHVSYDPIA